ncbi:HNH endonuclease signature motif containing protein [Myceligenerans crystallogenes]|uniref:HNH endonuclease signature motif containing protein n=1 Tax=Myceligenerans crystallogenes TaxID=316335 RepID=UPI0031DFDA01
MEQAATIVKDRLKVTAAEGSQAVIRAHECARFPRVLHALESGQVTARKADTLLRAGQGLTEDERAAAIEVLLPEAPSRTWKWLSDQLNALTVRLHGSTLEVRQAEERSNVWLETAGPGMGLLSALLPAKDAARVYNAVQAGSDQLMRLPGQTRRRGQARAAALTSLITGRIIPHPISEHTTDPDTTTSDVTAVDVATRYAPGVDTTVREAGGTATGVMGRTGSSTAAGIGARRDTDTDTGQVRLSVPVTGPGVLVEPSADTDLVPVPHEDDGILSTAPRPTDNEAAAGEVGVVIRGIEVPATINVVVPANVLADPGEDTPGILDHLGPIPADLARQIAAEGLWRRLVTDPVTGILTDYGTTAYQPPTHLRDAVRHRDHTCTHHGCDHPATHCDLDHITPYNHQQPQPPGQPPPTRADNLHALCRHHHNLKTLAGWEVQRDPTTGTEHWTSPTGHTATYQPQPTDPQHRYQTINQIQLPENDERGSTLPENNGRGSTPSDTSTSRDQRRDDTPPAAGAGSQPTNSNTEAGEAGGTGGQNPRKPEGHPAYDRNRRPASGADERNANRQKLQDTTNPDRQNPDNDNDNAGRTTPEGSLRRRPTPEPQSVPRLTVARPLKNPATPTPRAAKRVTPSGSSSISDGDDDALPPF